MGSDLSTSEADFVGPLQKGFKISKLMKWRRVVFLLLKIFLNLRPLWHPKNIIVPEAGRSQAMIVRNSLRGNNFKLWIPPKQCLLNLDKNLFWSNCESRKGNLNFFLENFYDWIFPVKFQWISMEGNHCCLRPRDYKEKIRG